jgi:hypothetical protein
MDYFIPIFKFSTINDFFIHNYIDLIEFIGERKNAGYAIPANK